jgi:hypothetical protein
MLLRRMQPRTISNTSTVVVSSQQVSTEAGREVVILNFEDGRYFGLDDVGARAWELIREPRTVAELRDTLVEEYEVEPDRCEADLRELLLELADAGLIEVN